MILRESELLFHAETRYADDDIYLRASYAEPLILHVTQSLRRAPEFQPRTRDAPTPGIYIFGHAYQPQYLPPSTRRYPPRPQYCRYVQKIRRCLRLQYCVLF
jgi:hypothetical protein